LLIPDFVFPVKKIEKMVSKKSLKFLLNVYSEDTDAYIKNRDERFLCGLLMHILKIFYK
jgi:hypothetical protein